MLIPKGCQLGSQSPEHEHGDQKGECYIICRSRDQHGADSAAIKGRKTAELQALAFNKSDVDESQLKKKESPIEDDLVLDLTHPQLTYLIVQ